MPDIGFEPTVRNPVGARPLPKEDGRGAGNLVGVPNIANYICVHGNDEVEHTKRLGVVMTRAEEKELKFNPDLCAVGLQ